MTTQQPDHRGRVPHRINARGERFCNECRQWLDPNAFAPKERGIGGRDAECRPCSRSRDKVMVGRRYAENPALYAKSLETARRCYRRRADAEYRDRLALAQAALATMRSAGWSWAEISRRSRVSLNALHDVRHGTSRYIRRGTVAKLMEAASTARSAGR